MIHISRFWVDRAAGKPLGPAWGKKTDVEIAFTGDEPLTLDEAEALPLNVWAALPMDRRQAVEVALYGPAVLTADRPILRERSGTTWTKARDEPPAS